MAPPLREASQDERDNMSLDEWLALEKQRLRHQTPVLYSESSGSSDDEAPIAAADASVLSGGATGLPEPEPEPEVVLPPLPPPPKYLPPVSAGEAARRICLVATSIHGAPAFAKIKKLPPATAAYDRSKHLRLLQAQADAAQADALCARGGDEREFQSLTPQQLVDLAARGSGSRMHALMGAADREREVLRELSALKESIMRRIEQIAREDRDVTKLQSNLVEQRRDAIVDAEAITRMRQQAEVTEQVARNTMAGAKNSASKMKNDQFTELRAIHKPPKSVLVAICIRIDEFCIQNHEFCTQNDGFCIKYDDFNTNGQVVMEALGIVREK